MFRDALSGASPKRPTRYDRTIYEVCRIPDGGHTGKLHYPLTVEGYRVVYKGYLADPDLQDARAGWPFVAIWDNHEFSWQGRQSIVQTGGDPRPGQTVKVAANQAWFEYIPARVQAPSRSLDTFGALAVKNVPIETWDDSGLGIEPNNLGRLCIHRGAQRPDEDYRRRSTGRTRQRASRLAVGDR